MSAPIEQRLRAALRAEAETIGWSDLRPEPAVTTFSASSPPPPTEAPADPPAVVPPTLGASTVLRRRRRPLLEYLLAAALIVGLVVGLTFVLRARHDDTGPPVSPAPSSSLSDSGTPSPQTSAANSSTSTAQSMLGTGQEGTRDQIPWNLVSKGWVLSLLYPPGYDFDTGGNVTLYLVDPVGGRYHVGNWPQGRASQVEVLDWSTDHRRALLRITNDADGATWRNQILDYDLASDSNRIMFSTASLEVGTWQYTRPQGLAVLHQYLDSSRQIRLERLGLDGRIQLDYPDQPTLGALRGFGSPTPYTRDGTMLVLPYDSAFGLVSNSGSLLRPLPYPPSTRDCSVTHWFDDASVVALCSSTADVTPGQHSVWRIPIDGANASLLGADPTDATAGFADDVWTFGGIGLLNTSSGCGSGRIYRIDGGRQELISVPGAIVEHSSVVGAIDDHTAIVRSLGSCQGGNALDTTLFAYDTATGRATVLLGGNGRSADDHPIVAS